MRTISDYYRIKDISRLYGIGPDSLRYYEEIGILTPRRGDNGYRLYGMGDIYKLNVIKDLRQLGFSMSRIKGYLDNKRLDNTLALLREEESIISAEMMGLAARERSIRARVSELASYEAADTRAVRVVECPERPCVRMEADCVRDEEIDLAMTRLHRRFDYKVYSMSGCTIGASQRVSDVRGGIRGLFRSVFFIVGTGEIEPDFSIPGGSYLSLHYRGGYGQSPAMIDELLSYADSKGRCTRGDILELYKIDIHETNDADEFLTELQVMVGPPPHERRRRGR
ncbi:MAG: MerR family transcriptional regulator [Synergistaceae bacterium]|nr:MerR family transcriptional regulator [Synergistaceae bacterium]